MSILGTDRVIIIYSNTSSTIKDVQRLVNAASISTKFIKKEGYKSTIQIANSKCLIINKTLTADAINVLNCGVVKLLVHGEYMDKYMNTLGAKQLIIICKTNDQGSIFPVNESMLMRCKFVNFS